MAALADAGLDIASLELGPETRTAQQAADAAGCALDQIAKSVIFAGQISGSAILFITAGGNQVDIDRASAVTEEPLSKADATLVRTQTGFAIDVIYAAAGTPRHIFPINPGLLIQISDAQVADFTSFPKLM